MNVVTKILILAANPFNTDRLKIDAEVNRIRKQLEASKHRERFEIEYWGGVAFDDFQERLTKYEPHIVHFTGHGSSKGELILEQGGLQQPVKPEVLGALFAVLKKNIRLVFLNACFSQAQAAAVRAVIDCTVTTADSVLDDAAIRFSDAFYFSLFDGETAQTAFNNGAVRVMQHHGQAEAEKYRLHTLTPDLEILAFVPLEGRVTPQTGQPHVEHSPALAAKGSSDQRPASTSLPPKPPTESRRQEIYTILGLLIGIVGLFLAVLQIVSRDGTPTATPTPSAPPSSTPAPLPTAMPLPTVTFTPSPTPPTLRVKVTTSSHCAPEIVDAARKGISDGGGQLTESATAPVVVNVACESSQSRLTATVEFGPSSQAVKVIEFLLPLDQLTFDLDKAEVQRLLKAVANYAKGDYKGAIPLLKELANTRAVPNDNVYLLLGYALMYEEQWRDAIDAFSKGIDERVTSDPHQQALALAGRGLAHTLRVKFINELYGSLSDIEKADIRKQCIAGASADFRSAASSEPTEDLKAFLSVGYLLAEFYCPTTTDDLTVETKERLDATATSLNGRGTAQESLVLSMQALATLLFQNEPQRAIEIAERASVLDGALPMPQRVLACAYFYMGDAAKASTAYKDYLARLTLQVERRQVESQPISADAPPVWCGGW